ncbi:acetyl-CoA carboxylase [Halococcus sediminicola]|uniref:acetyl-CoA carboxylase n=1 Tax=Halococcus sediminicola TaxID=1264579 RepID=UPI0006792F91|nr:acetyl-CoA carboxylase [Halococcus sediminicola]
MSENTTIEAPMPGVFYRRPDPDEEFYVEEGDRIEEGDVVGMIGVMKNFNEITSDADGVVERVFVENEVEIEAGQELVEIAPE